MSLTALTPMLTTDKLDGTIEFYTRVLGFSCEDHDKDWGWAHLNKDKVSIMFATPNAHLPFDRPTFTGSFYFRTSEVEKWWHKLKDKTKIAYPLEDFDYGMREFAIYDNNGYLLQFGQPLDDINKS